MHLFVMRHGPAERNAPSGRDYDRALTPAGRERTLAVARELVRLGECPSEILSSPLVRARETAEIVASVLQGGRDVTVREELAPSGDSFALVREILASQSRSVLVVGHEPDVSAIAVGLLRDWRGGFEAAMIVALEVAAGVAERRFVLAPSSLSVG